MGNLIDSLWKVLKGRHLDIFPTALVVFVHGFYGFFSLSAGRFSESYQWPAVWGLFLLTLRALFPIGCAAEQQAMGAEVPFTEPLVEPSDRRDPSQRFAGALR